MNELSTALTKAIRSAKLSYRPHFWIGIIKHENARKYTHEVFYYNTAEGFDEHLSFEEQIESAETQLCTNLQQAYAVGFDALKSALNNEEYLQVVITDLTNSDEEE